MSKIDWDHAFNNMGHVAGSEALPGLWSDAAAAYRETVQIETDIAYGPGERHVFDLILPDATPNGLVVFVHGGFWMRLSKDYWSHYAEGARTQGWAVAIPSYTLAPQARLSEITREVGAATSAAARQVSGPIRLIGHSAGGHLVSRMVTATSPLMRSVLDRVEHTISLSGLHDLRPLMRTRMNETLCIDEEEAQSESAALLRPQNQPRITAWVGGGERPEFVRQSELLHMMWSGLDAASKLIVDGKHDHFTVLEALRNTGSDLVKELVG